VTSDESLSALAGGEGAFATQFSGGPCSHEQGYDGKERGLLQIGHERRSTHQQGYKGNER